MSAQEGSRIDQLQRGAGMQLQQQQAAGAQQLQAQQASGAMSVQQMQMGGAAQQQSMTSLEMLLRHTLQEDMQKEINNKTTVKKTIWQKK